MAAVKYRPELDGLRAFAVLPILLFHLGLDWIAGGYIGVDVFFVVSGYLITAIVLGELESGTFTFRGFWARRIRRILPALVVVTAATLAATEFLVFKGDRPLIAQQAVAALCSFANVHFWLNTGDYWSASAEESPFLHTWSLSVEEQFYLLFPVTVWIAFRHRPQWMGQLFLCVIVASLALFLYGLQSGHETATFYLLPTRAWELGTGCFLAVLFRGRDEHDPSVAPFASLALPGLALIVASYFLLPEFDGGLVIAILGTALVIAFCRSGVCHRILTQRPVVYVGKISYSLYLWHWPVMVFATYLGATSHTWALLVLIFVLSIASYEFVEQPTRRRAGAIPLIATCYLAVVGFGGALIATDAKYDTSAFEQPAWCGLFYDLKPRGEVNAKMRRVTAMVAAPRRESPPDAYLHGGIIVGAGDGDPKVVVLGDSHGTMWSDAIRSVVEKSGVRASFCSMNAISPFVQFPLSREQQVEYLSPEEKYRYDQARIESIEKWQPAVVVVCVRWSNVTEAAARDLLGFLEENAGRVLLMEQPPELAIGNRNALQFLCFRGVEPEPGVQQFLPLGNEAEWRRGQATMRRLAREHGNCDVIPTFDLYCRDSKVLVLDGKRVVYLDDDHLTIYGTHLAAARIEQKLAESLKASAAPRAQK
jgi:peptidoglycan/LPS O-acetylase OafA/YrhL